MKRSALALLFGLTVNNLKNGNYVEEISDGKTLVNKPLLVAH